jgi:hypothetical protein
MYSTNSNSTYINYVCHVIIIIIIYQFSLLPHLILKDKTAYFFYNFYKICKKKQFLIKNMVNYMNLLTEPANELRINKEIYFHVYVKSNEGKLNIGMIG